MHLSFDPLLPSEEILPVDHGAAEVGCCRSNYGSELIRFFRERGAPMLHTCPTPASQASYFRVKGGYRNAACISVSDLLKCFPSPLLNSSSSFSSLSVQFLQDEPFDEFHSLALTNKHYGLTFASSSSDLFHQVTRGLFSSGGGGETSCTTATTHAQEIARQALEAKNRKLILERIQRSNSDSSNISSNVESPLNLSMNKVIIRTAASTDLSSVHALLASGFADVSCKYQSVRKFIKAAKGMQKSNVYKKILLTSDVITSLHYISLSFYIQVKLQEMYRTRTIVCCLWLLLAK